MCLEGCRNVTCMYLHVCTYNKVQIKMCLPGRGGGRVGERNLLLCWRKEGTSLTFGNFTVNFCNKSKFSSGHLLIPTIPARSVHDSGVLLLFCELHEKYHINNRTSSIHVQYTLLFQYCHHGDVYNIDTIST